MDKVKVILEKSNGERLQYESVEDVPSKKLREEIKTILANARCKFKTLVKKVP